MKPRALTSIANGFTCIFKVPFLFVLSILIVIQVYFFPIYIKQNHYLFFFISIILIAFFQLIMVIYSYKIQIGEKADIISSVEICCRRFFPVLAVSIVAFIIISFGFLLFLIPGLFFVVKLCYVYYFPLIEGENFSNSFKKSWNLTTGYFWKLFFIIIFFSIVNLFIAAFLKNSYGLNYLLQIFVNIWHISALVNFFIELKKYKAETASKIENNETEPDNNLSCEVE